MRNAEELNRRKRLEVMMQLIRLAGRWGREERLDGKFASVLIYANMTEFLAGAILNSVQLHITIFTRPSKVSLSLKDIREVSKNRPPTLGKLIEQLKFYRFPHKEEVIRLLKKIKKARNKLIHDLLTIQEQSSYVDGLMRDMQNDVEKLLDLSGDFQNELGIKERPRQKPND